jgi:hypothetical protein
MRLQNQLNALQKLHVCLWISPKLTPFWEN